MLDLFEKLLQLVSLSFSLALDQRQLLFNFLVLLLQYHLHVLTLSELALKRFSLLQGSNIDSDHVMTLTTPLAFVSIGQDAVNAEQLPVKEAKRLYVFAVLRAELPDARSRTFSIVDRVVGDF